MPEITYQELRSYLKDLDAPAGRAPAAVHLIHGEDLFVRMAFDEILRCILPGAQESLNYEPLDGAAAGVGDVVASLNTYSLLGGAKVVALKDARLFHTREDAKTLLGSARAAQSEGDLPRAARRFLAMLAQLKAEEPAEDRSAWKVGVLHQVTPGKSDPDWWVVRSSGLRPVSWALAAGF